MLIDEVLQRIQGELVEMPGSDSPPHRHSVCGDWSATFVMRCSVPSWMPSSCLKRETDVCPPGRRAANADYERSARSFVGGRLGLPYRCRSADYLPRQPEQTGSRPRSRAMAPAARFRRRLRAPALHLRHHSSQRAPSWCWVLTRSACYVLSCSRAFWAKMNLRAHVLKASAHSLRPSRAR